MATTPPPPTTGTSSTSPGWAPDLGVGVSGVTTDLGNGHAMLDTWRPRGRPVVKWEPLSGPTAKRGIEALCPRLASEHKAERTRRMCDFNPQRAPYPNLIINDIMA